jgi:hypothetical protein
VLWPEHFDIGISVDEVNYGVSPGDVHIPEPYAYVGPWHPRVGTFWNTGFGRRGRWSSSETSTHSRGSSRRAHAGRGPIRRVRPDVTRAASRSSYCSRPRCTDTRLGSSDLGRGGRDQRRFRRRGRGPGVESMRTAWLPALGLLGAGRRAGW